MAKRTTRKKMGNKEAGRPNLDAVLETVRSLWTTAEQAEPEVRDWVRSKIADGVERLRKQTETKLNLASITGQPTSQKTLFAEPEKSSTPKNGKATETPQKAKSAPQPQAEVPRFPEAHLKVYAKDFAPQALNAVPLAADFASADEYRDHLSRTLPFNAVATRRRAASYFVSRFFPGHHLHRDLALFAKSAAGKPALADALFYLTCRTEKIVAMVAESVVWPALADGGVTRARIREYVASQLPNSKSAAQVAVSIAKTYETFGIGRTTKTRLNVALRKGSLPTFAYILHLEFPEPGMYTFEKLLDGPMHKWLLWEKDWMIEQLYACRQAGLLTKISEIDAMRQFTTKYPLPGAVDNIVKLLEENG